jgi:hypothetical protein
MAASRTTQLAQSGFPVAKQASPSKLPRAFWGLLLLTVLVRSAGIDRPLVGNFATKSVAYAMIARNWATGAAPIERPTLDCLAGGDRGWHLLDFPVAAYLAGGAWSLLGGNLDVWGRALAIVFSTASVALMFLLVRRWHGETAAWGASLVLALSPVSIIYGQSFMLEPSMVFFTLATLGSFELGVQSKRNVWFILGALCLGLLLLTKIYMLVLLLPLAAIVVRGANAANPTSRLSHCLWPAVAIALAVLPAVAWYTYAWHISAPESDVADRVIYSNHHSASNHPFPHPLLVSAGFYARLFYNLAGPVMTPIALLLALVALTQRSWRQHAPWIASMGLLLIALPLKFHEMNYYYLVILPPMCVLAGLGWQVVKERFQPGRIATASLLAISVAISLRLSIGPAFVTPAEDRAVLVAAEATRKLTRPGESVATMHGSTIDLLYYCDRPGWAIAPDQTDLALKLEDLNRHGARILVVCNLQQIAANQTATTVLANLAQIAEGHDYRIYRLDQTSHVQKPAHEPSTPRLR